MFDRLNPSDILTIYNKNPKTKEEEELIETLKTISNFILCEQFVIRKNNRLREESNEKIRGEVSILVELDMESAIQDKPFFQRIFSNSRETKKRQINITYPSFLAMKKRDEEEKEDNEEYKKIINEEIEKWLDGLNYIKYKQFQRKQKTHFFNHDTKKFLIPVKINLKKTYTINELTTINRTKYNNLFKIINHFKETIKKRVEIKVDCNGNPKPKTDENVLYCGWNEYYNSLFNLFNKIEFIDVYDGINYKQVVGTNKKVILTCLDGNENRYSQKNTHELNIEEIKLKIDDPSPDIIYTIDKIRDFFRIHIITKLYLVLKKIQRENMIIQKYIANK